MAVSLAVLSLSASACPAAASVTIGQLAPAPSVSCAGTTFDFAQPTVTSGSAYVVPQVPPASSLVISSWSHNAANTAGPLTFKIFRPITGLTYTVVGHDGPRPLVPSSLNTFPVNIPAKPGDVIGINSAVPATTACTFSAPGESFLLRSGNLADGESGAFSPGPADRGVNVSAVVAPSNAFTLGAVRRNKKKGTATLTVNVPNPGTVALSGKGIKPASAVSSAPGDVRLQIKATGKKRRKLNELGKVKVNPSVTYTPTGGVAATQSRKVKLRKRL
ncbi:MAG: hypothetical protein ABR536_04825 [Solirubrobacterales bacterium]